MSCSNPSSGSQKRRRKRAEGCPLSGMKLKRNSEIKNFLTREELQSWIEKKKLDPSKAKNALKNARAGFVQKAKHFFKSLEENKELLQLLAQSKFDHPIFNEAKKTMVETSSDLAFLKTILIMLLSNSPLTQEKKNSEYLPLV